MEDTKDNELQTEIFKLDPEMELRFEAESEVKLELIHGSAEVFGAELASNKPYNIRAGSKVAVYSWEGCKVTLTGKTEVAYTVNDTPMTLYLNTHVALNQMRDQANAQSKRGPRVLVVGPTDVGKSTLCRYLINYAVRMDHSPVLVDLDVGQGEIGVPGTIGAIVVDRPSDVEEGFQQTAPLVYHYGYKAPDQNLDLYNLLVTRLAEVVNMRCEKVAKTKTSGVIINTCGWTKGGGYRALTHTAGAFEVDLVLVLDQERLYSELRRDMPDFVKVILLPKSRGVVERSKSLRAQLRTDRIHEYFYGIKNNLYPHRFEVKFSEVKVFTIGAEDLPSELFPVGMSQQDNKTKCSELPPSMSMMHHVMSVSDAESIEDDIVSIPVVGFIVVTEVNVEKQTFSILSPIPRPLSKHILLLMDDVTYLES